jgi:hypothetical protein
MYYSAQTVQYIKSMKIKDDIIIIDLEQNTLIKINKSMFFFRCKQDRSSI